MKIRAKLSDGGRLRQAVHYALMGVAGTGLVAGPAGAQETTELDTIEVTGTLIKRAEMETASPVTVIDRAAIETSGVATLGQLLQEMPNIAGAATNPQVNNGGGDGTATVSLRGLGFARTLLLLNGRRLVNIDVNAIPINMIERVEVLKDGASSTYGSDAIGGVVNFITRSNFQGAEYLYGYGKSARNDGSLTNVWGTFGSTTDRGTTVMGLNYDNRRQISSRDREHSKAPFALYYGEKIVLGSSRNPNGVYRVPRSVAAGAGILDANCTGTGSTVLLTRRAGQDGSSMGDYRCFDGSGSTNDTFNFQPDNVNLTPQERYGAFLLSNVKLTDNVDGFLEAFYHNTQANFQIAPEPLDAATRGLVASADSVYNPFGVAVSDVRLRLVAVGNREEAFDSDRFQFSAGLNGMIFDRFSWDGHLTLGQEKQTSAAFGELYVPGLQNAIGPSFFNASGDPVCGTATAPIAGCTPVNVFGVPTQESMEALTPEVHDRTEQTLLMYHAKIRGDVVQLPAGPLAFAAGWEWREQELDFQPDFLREQALMSGNASSTIKGKFDVNEFFGELAVPIVGDMPGIQSLQANLGIRFSDYSTFGETTNSKLGLEYRPMRELLVRTTYAEVFRSPTITNLFGGQFDSADTYVDPCNNLTAATPANVRDRACGPNVPIDGTFKQQDTQLNARVGGNPDVGPEDGNSYTLGFVYDPEWYEPLTLVFDYWNFELDDTIAPVGTQTRLDQCFSNGLFCTSFDRNNVGQITELRDLVENVGSLETTGMDIGASLRFNDTPWGKFRAQLDMTYLIKWDNLQLAGAPETLISSAGRFNESSAGGDGNFPRVRFNTHVDWKWNDVYVLWSSRYIHAVTEAPGDFGEDSADPCDPSVAVKASGVVCNREVGAEWYQDLFASYTFAPWKTEFALGVDNLTDRTAPLIYSGFNGSTDVRTYDTIGRFFFARVKMNF